MEQGVQQPSEYLRTSKKQTTVSESVWCVAIFPPSSVNKTRNEHLDAPLSVRKGEIDENKT